MKKYRDTTTGEVMTYDEIAVNFEMMKKAEPNIWEPDDDVDDFIGFHLMCCDIEEVE